MSTRLGLEVSRGSVVLGVSRVEEMNTEVVRQLPAPHGFLRATGGRGQKPGKGEGAPSARLGGDTGLFRLQFHSDLNLSIHQLPWVSLLTNRSSGPFSALIIK